MCVITVKQWIWLNLAESWEKLVRTSLIKIPFYWKKYRTWVQLNDWYKDYTCIRYNVIYYKGNAIYYGALSNDLYENQLFKPCGVDYQLKTHLAESLDDKPEKL